MADEAEFAFLTAQQDEYDPAVGFTMTDAPDEEEYDPNIAFSPNLATGTDRSASMPPASASHSPPPAAESELKPSPAETSADSVAPVKRPRTVGGFVDESEDEEDEATGQSSAANAAEPAQSPQPTSTQTPKNTLPTPHLSLPSAQDQGAASSSSSASVAVHEPASIASVVAHGTSPVADAAEPPAPNPVTITAAAPHAIVPPTASLPKARLPQDRLGILQDRIAEDPRGDIEAWLSLIEDHRKRHKHDEARAVFERFLKLFPTAVSLVGPTSSTVANVLRASNGLSTLPLRQSLTSCPR